MFRKVSKWLTDKGDQFVRGGQPQDTQADSAYEYEAETDNRQIIDPFNDGDVKYGGRQPYRSRAEQEAEAYQAQLQAQQEQEAYQAQMQAQYQQEQMQQAAAYQQQGYQQQGYQQVPYQQEQMQQTGAYQQQGYQQAPYQQEQMQQTGAYQQQGYQQAPYQQEQMQQTGAYQQQGYQQAPYQQEQMQQTGAYQQQGYQQAPYQQEQQPPQQPGGNVVTFPGMQTTPEGMVYAHVEYIVQLTSRNECRKVIDYIRSNASVFLNMEMIVEPSERQRCVDMLSGAAYALGCALNKISPRGVYLISSPSVRVMMDNATQKMAAAPEVRSFARQSYSQEHSQQRYQAQQQPSREEEPEEAARSGGFSSGSPTQRFQSQGAQGMSVSFGTAMAGSHTSMHRAINAQRYNAQ